MYQATRQIRPTRPLLLQRLSSVLDSHVDYILHACSNRLPGWQWGAGVLTGS